MSLKQIKKERERERGRKEGRKKGRKGQRKIQNSSLYVGLDDDVKHMTHVIITSPVSMAHIV